MKEITAIVKNLLAALMLLVSPELLLAQPYELHLRLTTPSTQDSVFVAGNFNGWNPGDKKFALEKGGKGWEIKIPRLVSGAYEFKFTRGSWNTVATSRTGSALPNNSLELKSDTSLSFSVEAWQDEFPPVEKKHTASRNVRILDTAFSIPQLGRTRPISIYLPPGYATSRRAYPVLYLQDGQNAFDEFTAANGEWAVDETLDSLVAKGLPGCIVVAVHNGPKRLNEYNPYDTERFGKGEGREYAQFLAKTLKPYIDRQYRTLKDKSSTMIAGSSMGGLISYYTVLAYPDVFGKGGIFSPAFWIAPQITSYTDSVSSKVNGKLFFYIGAKEGASHVADMHKVMERLGTHSTGIAYAVTDPEGQHNEAAWRKWFPEFYKFMMADWTNYPIPLKN